jgi:hypothetical protein
MSRRRQQAGKDTKSGPGRKAARTAAKPTEGRVVGKKKDQNDEDLERFFARIQSNPHHAELMRQKVMLKTTGAELLLHDATALLDCLREMQERKPDQFAALVAIVKPRGATCPPSSKVSPKALAVLKKHGLIGPDGSPEQRIAAILDAAYVETTEGVVLRDPIVYPSQQFVDELTRLDSDLAGRMGRALCEEIEAERRNRRGKDDGPSR